MGGTLQWLSLVCRRFGGRISHKWAQECTVGEVLSAIPPDERPMWEHAYEQLEATWNMVFHFMERNFSHSEHFTELFWSMQLTRATKMVLVVPDYDNASEGLLFAEFVEWLVYVHNEVVLVAGEVSGHSVTKISSEMMGPEHVILQDEEVLMRYVLDQCINNAEGGRLSVDVARLNEHLQQEFSRPKIQVRSPRFIWLGHEPSFYQLERIIAQENLPQFVAYQLFMEIHSVSEVEASMLSAQMTCACLLAAGLSFDASQVGDALFGEYLSKALAEAPEPTWPMGCKGKVPEVAGQLRLCHMDAYMCILQDIFDVMRVKEKVHVRYQADIGPELADALATVVEDFADRAELIASSLEVLGESALSEDQFASESQPLKDWILFDEDEDLAFELQEKLPAGLELRHFGQVHRAFFDQCMGKVMVMVHLSPTRTDVSVSCTDMGGNEIAVLLCDGGESIPALLKAVSLQLFIEQRYLQLIYGSSGKVLTPVDFGTTLADLLAE